MRRVTGRLGAALVVLAVAAAGAVVLARCTAVQEWDPLWLASAALSGVATALLASAALVGGLAAAWGGAPGGRRWLLAAPVLAVAALQMAWPTAWGLLRPEDPVGGARISVLAQNVWRSNPDPGAAARALVAQDADVVVLTEFTPEFLVAFRRAGSDRAYPHRILRDRPDTQGMAVFSRVPMDTPARQASLYRTEATLRPAGSAPVHLVAVHVPAPTTSGVQGWAEEFARLTGRVEDLDGPVVVAGDFNATSGNRPFRHLAASAGLRDAQDAGGGGFGGTWSLESAGPPMLRLDHVMVARSVGVAAFGFVPPLGSDHRGVVAELRFPRE